MRRATFPWAPREISARHPALFCEWASRRPSKGLGEALPAQRPIPASATPTPAPWQDLDTVGVDVFPAQPHPMVLTEPQIPEPSPPAGRACGPGPQERLVGGGHVHSRCPPVSAAHNPETPKRRHAGLSGIIPVLLPPFPLGTVCGCGERPALSWTPARGQGSHVVVSLSPAGSRGLGPGFTASNGPGSHGHAGCVFHSPAVVCLTS